MARYREAVCRLCRREGQKLFLKGQRCLTDKCAIEKRNFPPGQHGKSRRPKVQGYGIQLREKQKVRRLYQILENQFRNYFEKAASRKGVTGETLLLMLEQRLDNVVYRLGLATSRAEARQLVRHGHIEVSGEKVNIPSFHVIPGQEIAVREKSRKLDSIQRSLDLSGNRGVPLWLALDRENLKAQVVSVPKREDVNFPIQEQMIVELYSK
ncbi:MAG: 30S ribosomal protein S4 [Acidobacteria bacterium]|nr:MAG: 30S ribosomal protein S4 [Acidobacteriota bacterium]